MHQIIISLHATQKHASNANHQFLFKLTYQILKTVSGFCDKYTAKISALMTVLAVNAGEDMSSTARSSRNGAQCEKRPEVTAE